MTQDWVQCSNQSGKEVAFLQDFEQEKFRRGPRIDSPNSPAKITQSLGLAISDVVVPGFQCTRQIYTALMLGLYVERQRNKYTSGNNPYGTEEEVLLSLLSSLMLPYPGWSTTSKRGKL